MLNILPPQQLALTRCAHSSFRSRSFLERRCDWSCRGGDQVCISSVGALCIWNPLCRREWNHHSIRIADLVSCSTYIVPSSFVLEWKQLTVVGVISIGHQNMKIAQRILLCINGLPAVPELPFVSPSGLSGLRYTNTMLCPKCRSCDRNVRRDIHS